mmetsp:Transcript_20087/g.43591  ORF Transcript_20087/g.43591 Transcript_20087/m.43591 type:complete len:392 (+) Transcript_20087:861-2036(+)
MDDVFIMDNASDEEDVEVMEVNRQPSSTAVVNMSDENKTLLLWRLPKEENFSDWSINVTTAEGTMTTYNVHRSALAVGPRKSGYFEALFSSSRSNESSSNACEVSLPEDATAIFPLFLDYFYCSPTERLGLMKRDTLAPLHFLAEYFKVSELTNDIDDFVQGDMRNLLNLETYVLRLISTDDNLSKFLRPRATKACAEQILSIETGSSLLHAIRPEMFIYVLEMLRSSKGISSNQHYHICRLAIDYARTHQGSLDANYCMGLFSDKIFPSDNRLARLVAIDILEITKLAGWQVSEWELNHLGVPLLVDYLAESDGPTIANVSEITSKIPMRAVDMLLVEAFKSPTELDTATAGVITSKIPLTVVNTMIVEAFKSRNADTQTQDTDTARAQN